MFVPLVENSYTADSCEVTRIISDEYISKLKEFSPDCIILGCTHYPFLADTIKKVAAAYHADSNLDSEFHLIDPAPAVARHLLEVMENEAIPKSAPAGFSIKLISSGNPQTLRKAYEKLV